MSYTKAYGVYLWGSFLILAGNTAAPVLLRGLMGLPTPLLAALMHV